MILEASSAQLLSPDNVHGCSFSNCQNFYQGFEDLGYHHLGGPIGIFVCPTHSMDFYEKLRSTQPSWTGALGSGEILIVTSQMLYLSNASIS
ncbi:hypothetical protein FKM82_010875 [Ascaphus truei]